MGVEPVKQRPGKVEQLLSKVEWDWSGRINVYMCTIILLDVTAQ